MPIDYSKGKIYTIRYRNDDSLIYVGSTVNILSYRFADHKRRCKNPNNERHNLMIYQKMRETEDIDNWYIELYEDFPCDNKEQLLKREGEIIREIGTLNRNIAGRSTEQYRKDNKEKYEKYLKEYRRQNKEKISENDKQRKSLRIQCECGSTINKGDLAKHRRTKKHLDLMNQQQAATN